MLPPITGEIQTETDYNFSFDTKVKDPSCESLSPILKRIRSHQKEDKTLFRHFVRFFLLSLALSLMFEV